MSSFLSPCFSFFVICAMIPTVTTVFRRNTLQFSREMEQNMKKWLKEHNIIKTGAYLLLFVVCLLFFYECPFHYLFGIPCPGCGMTRALFSVILLRFGKAFYYHPGIFLIIPGFLLWCADYFKFISLKPKTKKVLLTLGIAALILIYFVRLFTGSDIVSVDLKSGLIYRILAYLPNWL